MSVGKRKCKSCGDYVREFIITPKGVFCNIDSAVKYAYDNKSKGKEVIHKAQMVKDKKRLKELKSRGDWYRELQTVVNYYVKHVKENNGPCRTCGTHNPNIKYDAGHYIAVGHNMDLRFELTNIHIQCSMQCNQFGRGMPVEYSEFIKKEYGEGHYHWLNTSYLCHKPHPTLKEQFPIWQDIEAEIKMYRALIKKELNNGI